MFTLSKKNNCILWLPPKAATTLLSWILFHFDFHNYFLDTETNELVQEEKFLIHLGHNMQLPPNHLSMDLLCPVRNPYDKVISFTKMHVQNKEDFSREFFEKNLENLLLNPKSLLFQSSKIFDQRIPNFIIRAEKIYEDLIEVPFIRNSKLNSCGILEDMCTNKLNETFKIDRENILTTDTREIIYQTFKKEFELFGYSK